MFDNLGNNFILMIIKFTLISALSLLFKFFLYNIYLFWAYFKTIIFIKFYRVFIEFYIFLSNYCFLYRLTSNKFLFRIKTNSGAFVEYTLM